MNNIYKVIWSKAKNCYVVASEIARSHTKSATGSEKIGGVTRRSLLASLMALSLLCGGLGVASASLEVVNQSGTDGTVTIYTKDEVDKALDTKGAATDVETNKAAIADLKNAVGVAGSGLTKEVADQKAAIDVNTASIDTNKAAIKSLQDDKLDKALATSTFAAKTELDAKANTDLSNLTEAGKSAIKNTMSADMDSKANKADVYSRTDANDKFATKDALNGKADQTALNQATDRITANEAAITGLTTKNTDQQTAIDDLKKKTAEISHEAGNGTNISGVTIKNGNIVGDGNSAITQLANVETDRIKTNSINGKSLVGTNVATTTEVEAAVNTEKTAREEADKALSNRIGTVADDGNYIKSSNTTNVSQNLRALDAQAKKNADNIQTNANDIKTNKDEIARVNGELVKTNDYFNSELSKTNDYFNSELSKTNNHFNTELEKTNAALQATNKRTAGIDRIDATSETTIEKNVKVDNRGNVTAKGNVTADGKLKGEGVDAGTGAITTTGAVNAGSLNVTGASHLEGDVTMDQKLSVTGDTSLKKTDVDGALTAKGDVILGTNKANMVTVNGKADFNEAVNMDNGLTVDKGLTVTGDTNLENTTVDGNLKVTGTITTDKMVFGDKATQNYTEIDHGKVTSKNFEVRAGEMISSSSTFDVEKNEVGFGNGITGEQSFHKQTSDIIMDNVKDRDNSNNRTQTKTETKDIITDKDGNSSTTSQTASENKTYLTDKDRKNTNSTIDTAKGYDKTIKGENGETSTKQDELNITNTAKDGTITNDANHIENKANTMDTNVTGRATESYGELDTTVKGNETHTVTGNQTNKIDRDQENTIGGNQTTTVTGNVKEDYKKDLATTVGGNENHEVKGTKTETVEGKVTENFKNGQETNVTGDQVIKVSGTQTTTATDIKRNASSGMIDTIDNDYGTNTETKVAGKTTTDVSIKGTGEKGQYIRGANESRDYLIKGTLKNSETKTAEKTSTEITDGNGNTSSTIQDVTQISGSVTDGTNTSVSNVKANSIDSAVTDGSSISTINQKKNSITSQVTDGTTITKTEQDTKNITNTAKDGTITNDAKDIVNNVSGNMTNTVGGDLTTTVSGNELHEVAGKQTNKIDGDQENTIGGNQTTTVTGDISNKAENITNEANTKLTDKVGENTRVLDSEGITDTVGGSTFKQRIDKIMMESKDVSIKAEETLTNEAKVITNRASEVINNEAVNINNTATGIITSKASEIKNQADKLISNKVSENTWENMENGKITTSIKDGAKQNLTQSDAAGTTQSTVDGGKSTVTIQNADGLADAVTDGTNTSVQNQTASAIAAAVKDGAGNENASVANATTSVNTIKSGSKANTVISTADGTSFINSEAAAPVGDGTEVKTTIKGNTITTGKVTMDYAEVMKDLGVRGNANITGKTTTGSLEVTGTSTLKGDVTMGSNATVNGNFTVNGTTNLKDTNVGGKLDVTGKATFSDDVDIKKNLSVVGDVTANSYKVGDKTYIDKNGIHANGQKITDVADGSISEGSKDAVNGGQLYTVKNDLEGKVNKVGANAAAMANLHPMEFDPDSKWNIAAAIGNYGSETAAALGAFYRPNDDVMVNLSTAFGTGENMVGGGVSVRLGKSGNKLSREESNALKDQVNDLTARMDALLSVLNPNMSKDFPDVPENHWAYEAVSRLAGNDIVQGYPDGEFHGERTMTRYEMAEIIYNALSRGAEAEKELVEEFKPELQAMAASEKATAEKAEG